jgi:hypothetical protein
VDKIKTAVIGYGKVAHIHAEALASLPESEFVAVCGRDAGKARAFGEQYRVKAFTSVEEMVGAGVRAVVVATPHPAHASVTTAALRAGAHAIVEKPLASSLEDCDAMIAAAREAGRTLAMISQRRLYAPVQRVRHAIDAGKLGRPALGTVAMLGWRSEEYYRSDPWRGSWAGEGGGRHRRVSRVRCRHDQGLDSRADHLLDAGERLDPVLLGEGAGFPGVPSAHRHELRLRDGSERLGVGVGHLAVANDRRLELVHGCLLRWAVVIPRSFYGLRITFMRPGSLR